MKTEVRTRLPESEGGYRRVSKSERCTVLWPSHRRKKQERKEGRKEGGGDRPAERLWRGRQSRRGEDACRRRHAMPEERFSTSVGERGRKVGRSVGR